MRAGEGAVEVFVQRRYRCPSCRKSWSSRGRASQHVAEGCHRNLTVRACSTCRHDDRGEHATWEEPGSPPTCLLGLRAEGEHIVRNCDQWEAKPWLLTA